MLIAWLNFMSLVLDSSVTMALIYGEETTSAVQFVWDEVRHQGAWAPLLWKWEVANVLQTGIRKRRHDAAFRDDTLADLARLPIRLDSGMDPLIISACVRLSDRHLLTIYDALYLELAMRLGLPLATLDADLHTAAIAEKVAVLGI